MVFEVVQSNDSKPNNFEISLYWGTVPVDLALAPVESKIVLAKSIVPPWHEVLKLPPEPGESVVNALF